MTAPRSVAHDRSHWAETLAQDLKSAWRGTHRAPGFAATVILTFALGIGANAAVFSLLDRLFIRAPSGVENPGQVYTLYQSHVDQRILSTPTRSAFSYRELREIKSSVSAGLEIAAYTQPLPPTEESNDLPDVQPTYVVGDYFGLLGVRPEIGRLFTSEETRIENVALSAIISRHLWLARFGGDQNIVGRTIHVDGQRYTVVGVAAEHFSGIDLVPIDLWLPVGALSLNVKFNPHVGATGPTKNEPPWYESRIFLHILGRARSPKAVGPAASQATNALRTAYPGDTSSVASLVTVSEGRQRDAGGSVVLITTRLAGVAGILLLITCANVATLLLSRGVRRRQEMAVRMALGASRWRQVRAMLTEGVLLAFLGSAAALLVGAGGAAALRSALLPGVQLEAPVLAPRLFLFAAASALFAGISAGLIPALTFSRMDPVSVLHGGGGAGVRQRSYIRGTLVATQSALSIMLLAGAGLFARSLHNVGAIDTGYAVDRLVLAHVPYDGNESITALGGKLPDLSARIKRVPGVEAVSLIANPMLTGFPKAPVYLNDGISEQKADEKEAYLSFVSPEYFATVGVRLIAGRLFTESDHIGTEPVTVVSQTLATTLWPGESPIGKCLIVFQQDAPCRTVIGMVSDVHAKRIVEVPSMRVYLPIPQMGSFPGSAMVIRAAPTRVRAVATEAQRMFGDAFGGDGGRLVQTMADVLAPEFRPWRLAVALFSTAGLCALLVAGLGIYASVAYGVSQRTHEMGLRAALGARPLAVVRLVVGQGVQVVVLGAAIGVAATLAVGKVVSAMLYRVTPHDPAVLVAVSLLVVGVAIVACLVPAWHATRVDPTAAMRRE